MSTETVWIVQHDESPDNTILGVFATEGEASNFMEQVGDMYGGQVLYSSYKIGYKFNEGPGCVEYSTE